VADDSWGGSVVQVDSARKRGVLLEAVQVLADLDLSINKAYISSDGRWFMDVFHVTDRLGRKLADDSVITYIKQVGFRFLGPRRRKQRLCRVLFLTVRVAARSRSRWGRGTGRRGRRRSRA